jgi:hypothetical protein
MIVPMEQPRRSLHRRLIEQIRRWRGRKKDPDEPYALVGAPKKPRPPLQTLAAKAKPELEQPV